MAERKENPFAEKALRNLNYTEFVMRMLDDRHNVEQLLRHKATAVYASYRGYREDAYIAPSALADLLSADPSSATLDFSVEKTGDTTEITSATIENESRPQVFIHEEAGTSYAVGEQGDLVVRLPGGTPEQALRSFLPFYFPEETTVDQAVQTFAILSPEKDEVVEFSGAGAGFFAHVRYSDVETYNDSIQTLEIINQRMHVSGALVGTRLRITESLLNRVNEASRIQTVDQRLEIATEAPSSKVEITVEEIQAESGRIVKVNIPTKRHMADIQAALSVLKRAPL